MAKGDRKRDSWRIVFAWRVVLNNGSHIDMTWPTQVPRMNPDTLLLNIRYRNKVIRKDYESQGIREILVKNMQEGSDWINFEALRGHLGLAKHLMSALIYSHVKKCPHCGNALPIELTHNEP